MTRTGQPTACDPGEAKAKQKVRSDISELKALVEDAVVVDVGTDVEYVPDSPRLRSEYPTVEDGDDNE